MRISDVFAMGGGRGDGFSGSCSSDCFRSSFERYEEHCYRYSDCHYGEKSSRDHKRGFLGIL
jgi:hypothetical protein